MSEGLDEIQVLSMHLQEMRAVLAAARGFSTSTDLAQSYRDLGSGPPRMSRLTRELSTQIERLNDYLEPEPQNA